MAYWEQASDRRLGAHVTRIAFSTDPPGAPAPAIRVVTDGRIDLVISVAEPGCGAVEVFGVKTAVHWAQSDRPVSNLALTFRPGSAALLLRTRADELTDRAVPASELLGAEWVERLVDAADLPTRRTLIETALLERLRGAQSTEDVLARAAAARIEACAGRIRIASLATALGVGERRLERSFRRRVGVAPKVFARIARFRAAWDALARGVPAADVALARGYFDQPHLLRDFRAFAGDSPRRIFPRPGPAAAPILGR